MTDAEKEVERLKDQNIHHLISKVMDQLADLKMQITQTKGNSEKQVTEAIQTLNSYIQNFMRKEFDKIDKYLETRIASTHNYLSKSCDNVDQIINIDQRLTKLEKKVARMDQLYDWWDRHGYKVAIVLTIIIIGLLTYMDFHKNEHL
jgi:hypothetical protein